MEQSDLPKTGPVVQTKLGGLRGQYVSVKGKETVVQAYLGVPFAKPPVGPLRLTPPQPVEGWERVRDATQQPLMCLQDRQRTVDFESNWSIKVEIPAVSEDCLYLNIYTPAKPAENTKLPVMVWIHGGGFAMGSASTYDGSALAAYQDVVVVVIQYRLGLLGFFSTGDKYAPGNMGLLDQVEALRWVQEHIHNFGGNSKSVTIFGESAGGVSVSLLLHSPLSAGLFHRAIAESGTASMDAIINSDPLSVAQVFSNSFSPQKKGKHCHRYTSHHQFPIFHHNHADEYLGTSGDRIKNRDGFIELVGDALFTIPALKTAGFHRDAGVPMYLYEFQQTPSMLKKMRPSFVGSDHGDELMFVFGYCFTTSHVTVDALCTEEDEQLSEIMMSYWGNFARTGSPNGVGLVQWPQYGPEGDYLGIGLEQVPGQHLKRDRFTFMTKILPEKVHLVQEKIKHSEL
uniref:Carboxylic ester hydrolase n=1 Tax=Oncorhynchus tshawytscha TaxID=74940 RepID=A0A8C8M9E7_ONCTS